MHVGRRSHLASGGQLKALRGRAKQRELVQALQGAQIERRHRAADGRQVERLQRSQQMQRLGQPRRKDARHVHLQSSQERAL